MIVPPKHTEGRTGDPSGLSVSGTGSARAGNAPVAYYSSPWLLPDDRSAADKAAERRDACR